MGGDEEVTLREWASLQRTLIEPRLQHWRGRIANRAGDGLLLEFGSALDAFRWAVEVQEGIASRSFHEVSLSVRISLHLGDVLDDEDGEVQGDGVNVAARLQAHALVGGIILSQAFADAVAGKTDRIFADLGLLALKNMRRPVRAFRVLGPTASADAAGVRSHRRR
ncbi:MAG: adenylate/guanylate cyclase domain-containing protein, partial [Janthinobacterium lividum]